MSGSDGIDAGSTTLCRRHGVRRIRSVIIWGRASEVLISLHCCILHSSLSHSSFKERRRTFLTKVLFLATAKTTPSPPTFSDGSDRSLLSSSLRREHEGGVVTGVAVGAIACVMMVTTLVRVNYCYYGLLYASSWMYTVNHHLSDLGWVDFDLDVPPILPS